MPGRYFDYYANVAERMLPFLVGRRVAIEQRFPDSSQVVYRRHAGSHSRDDWIQIQDAEDVRKWARQYAEGFHANIRSEDRGAWFVIDIDSRDLPLELARLTARHAVDVLSEQGLTPLITFSGSDGFHLMWDVPDLETVSDERLWKTERAMVRAVACQVAARLATDPVADPIRRAVGEGNPMIATGSADRENASAILFDEYILKDNANFRVPYSIHPKTGLSAAPIRADQLAEFSENEAAPDVVATRGTTFQLPRYRFEDIEMALEAWHADGC
jgi:DNA primase